MVIQQRHNCCHALQCRMDEEGWLPNNPAVSKIKSIHVYTKISPTYTCYTKHIYHVYVRNMYSTGGCCLADFNFFSLYIIIFQLVYTIYLHDIYNICIYSIYIFIKVEPHGTTQMQISPDYHGQQRRIAHTQFAGNADQGLFHSSSIQLNCASL